MMSGYLVIFIFYVLYITKPLKWCEYKIQIVCTTMKISCFEKSYSYLIWFKLEMSKFFKNYSHLTGPDFTYIRHKYYQNSYFWFDLLRIIIISYISSIILKCKFSSFTCEKLSWLYYFKMKKEHSPWMEKPVRTRLYSIIKIIQVNLLYTLFSDLRQPKKYNGTWLTDKQLIRLLIHSNNTIRLDSLLKKQCLKTKDSFSNKGRILANFSLKLFTYGKIIIMISIIWSWTWGHLKVFKQCRGGACKWINCAITTVTSEFRNVLRVSVVDPIPDLTSTITFRGWLSDKTLGALTCKYCNTCDIK